MARAGTRILGSQGLLGWPRRSSVVSRELRLSRRLLQRLGDQSHSGADNVIVSFLGDNYAIPRMQRLRIMIPEVSIPWTGELWRFYTLGSMLLELESKIYVLEHGSISPAERVNGLNFGPLVTATTKQYLSDEVLSMFVRENGLDAGILSERKIEGPVQETVKSLKLLVGAVYACHGHSVARKFVQEKILAGFNGLFHLGSLGGIK